MAIDGVNIIDSDLAHDIQNSIMDMWHEGKSPAHICTQIRQDYAGETQEPHREIMWTAFALTLWQIGCLDESVKNEVAQIMRHGASAAWLKIDPKAQAQRQKRLDALWTKLQSDNPKPTKRRPYKKIAPDEYLFNEGDILLFRLPENRFAAMVLLNISQLRGQCDYLFGKLQINPARRPDTDSLLTANIYARKNIGCDDTKIIRHKHLKKFRDRFETVAHVDLDEHLRQAGTQSAAYESFEELCEYWDDCVYAKKSFLLLEFLTKLPEVK